MGTSWDGGAGGWRPPRLSVLASRLGLPRRARPPSAFRAASRRSGHIRAVMCPRRLPPGRLPKGGLLLLDREGAPCSARAAHPAGAEQVSESRRREARARLSACACRVVQPCPLTSAARLCDTVLMLRLQHLPRRGATERARRPRPPAVGYQVEVALGLLLLTGGAICLVWAADAAPLATFGWTAKGVGAMLMGIHLLAEAAR